MAKLATLFDWGVVRTTLCLSCVSFGYGGITSYAAILAVHGDVKPERLKLVGEKVKADFTTGDYRELLARPEVTAAIISTDEHLHVEPILAAAERGLDLLIE